MHEKAKIDIWKMYRIEEKMAKLFLTFQSCRKRDEAIFNNL